MKIVGNKRGKVSWANILIPAVAVAISAVIIVILVQVTKGKEVEEDPVDYDQQVEIYKSKGMEYTMDDYKRDKQIQETKAEGESKVEPDDWTVSRPADEILEYSPAAQELQDQNVSILDAIAEDTMVEETDWGLMESIYQQTLDYNQFIDSHLGWPDSDYGDNYMAAKLYIDNVLDSFTQDRDADQVYGDGPSKIRAEVRFSISEGEQYRVGNGFTQYYDILSNYMSMGHPLLSGGTAISVEQPETEMIYDDVFYCDLIAYLSCDGGNWKVYLTARNGDNGESYYKILDVERM